MLEVVVVEILLRSELMSLIKGLRKEGEIGKVARLEKLLSDSYKKKVTKIKVPVNLLD